MSAWWRCPFVLIYKATETVSFMQGELLMLGAFAALYVHEGLGWPLIAAAGAAVAGMFVFGALLERGSCAGRSASRTSPRCCSPSGSA